MTAVADYEVVQSDSGRWILKRYPNRAQNGRWSINAAELRDENEARHLIDALTKK